MTNSRKLKGKITENGYTLSSFSNAVHISRPSLRKRLNGEADFKASEIENICEVLDLSREDMCSIFFAQ